MFKSAFKSPFGLFCLTLSIYSTMVVFLRDLAKCCEVCLKKTCKTQIGKFIANIITGLIKRKQVTFPLQIILQGSQQIFLYLKVAANYHRSLLLCSVEQIFWIWASSLYVTDGHSALATVSVCLLAAHSCSPGGGSPASLASLAPSRIMHCPESRHL